MAALTMTRLGTIDELLATAPPLLRPPLASLRQLILDIHPGAVEVVRLGERAATYGIGPKYVTRHPPTSCRTRPCTGWRHG